MARRSFALGFITAALLAVGALVGSAFTRPATVDAGPKAEAKPLRAGHICLSELMTTYSKWQARSKELGQKRDQAGAKLSAMQNIIAAGSKQVEAATGADKSRLSNEMIEAKRKFEDAERTFREELDREAAEHLTSLYDEIATGIKQLADERQLDVVYGYPAHPQRVMEQAKENKRAAIDLLLRPQAMQPIYLRDSVDLTAEVVERLNAKYDREEK